LRRSRKLRHRPKCIPPLLRSLDNDLEIGHSKREYCRALHRSSYRHSQIRMPATTTIKAPLTPSRDRGCILCGNPVHWDDDSDGILRLGCEFELINDECPAALTGVRGAKPPLCKLLLSGKLLLSRNKMATSSSVRMLRKCCSISLSRSPRS